MGESSSKVVCVAFRDLNIFLVGVEKMEFLVCSVCWLTFVIYDGDLVVVLWLLSLPFYGFPLSIYRRGMPWSEFQAFPMDNYKSLKGHISCLSKVA